MTKMLEDAARRMLSEARDVRRPTMQAVLAALEPAFEQMNVSIVRTVDGPPTWIWEDREMSEIGLARYYVLSEATSEGIEGFPLFTIRQAYSLCFDMWISMSSLVIGPDPEDIARSISLAMSQHMGAFAGTRHVASTISANRHSPLAGMIAAKALLEAPPPIVTGSEVDEMVASVGVPSMADRKLVDDGGMN